ELGPGGKRPPGLLAFAGSGGGRRGRRVCSCSNSRRGCLVLEEGGESFPCRSAFHQKKEGRSVNQPTLVLLVGVVASALLNCETADDQGNTEAHFRSSMRQDRFLGAIGISLKVSTEEPVERLLGADLPEKTWRGEVKSELRKEAPK